MFHLNNYLSIYLSLLFNFQKLNCSFSYILTNKENFNSGEKKFRTKKKKKDQNGKTWNEHIRVKCFPVSRCNEDRVD